MKSFRELFNKKDQQSQSKLIMAFLVGILLIILSNTVLKTKTAATHDPPTKTMTATPSLPNAYDGYEERLENKLEQVINKVDGVGNVKVMITLSYGREIVLASDSLVDQSATKEEDSDGGKREVNNLKREDKTVITNNSPLVLKELKPKIEGIVIVAQGGDNIIIKDALIKSAQALFGVEANKIEVLKMK